MKTLEIVVNENDVVRLRGDMRDIRRFIKDKFKEIHDVELNDRTEITVEPSRWGDTIITAKVQE